jgi:predicted nuclease of restriction endonuclease-like (RecB) superfamily
MAEKKSHRRRRPTGNKSTASSRKTRLIAREGRISETRQEFIPSLPVGYAELLNELKHRIRHAQVRAVAAANRELIRLYWDVGRIIVEKQKGRSWGKGIVDRLAADIQREFPGIAGFSKRNIQRMRAFYLAYTSEVVIVPQPAAELDSINLPQVAAEIPWFHNVILIEKVKDPLQRLWYAQKTVQHGWSRAILVHQIELDLYRREGRAITNFDQTLPAPQSDLAQDCLFLLC